MLSRLSHCDYNLNVTIVNYVTADQNMQERDEHILKNYTISREFLKEAGLNLWADLGKVPLLFSPPP